MTQEAKAWLKAWIESIKSDAISRNGWVYMYNMDRIFEIIQEQEKEIERLKEVLQFYADKETYKLWFSKSGEEFKTYPTNASIDIGFKARQALEAK